MKRFAARIFESDQVDFSNHAMKRVLDMALEGESVQRALFDPDRVSWSAKHENYRFYAGDFCLVAARHGARQWIVVTALWANDKAWKRDLERGEYGGRSYRGRAA